jgi:putative effector of murein hydrolase LrgA (UPF0299 family)
MLKRFAEIWVAGTIVGILVFILVEYSELWMERPYAAAALTCILCFIGVTGWAVAYIEQCEKKEKNGSS